MTLAIAVTPPMLPPHFGDPPCHYPIVVTAATTSPSIYATTPSRCPPPAAPYLHDFHGLSPIGAEPTLGDEPEVRAQPLSQQSRGWAAPGSREARRGDSPPLHPSLFPQTPQALCTSPRQRVKAAQLSTGSPSTPACLPLGRRCPPGTGRCPPSR